MFYLLSGAAASGKSSYIKMLKNSLPNLQCHDADEKVTKTREDRLNQLNEWVELALEHQANNLDFLLASHSPLGELLACNKSSELEGISACLIDCHDHNRISRMRSRGIDPDWPPTQDVLSWASWHRMHVWDSTWQQHVVLVENFSGFDFKRWDSWKKDDKRWNNRIIDTTNLTTKEGYNQICSWINKEKENRVLSKDNNWWV